MSTDIDTNDGDDNEDKGPDAIAEGSPDVVATSARSITVEMQQERARLRHAIREEWKTKPLRAAFRRVALPSAVMGGLAYLLSMAHGEPNAVLAAAAGAAYYPTHAVAEPVARWAGKISGHLKNMFGRNLYYQQVTKEISSEAFTRGVLLTLLLNAAVMGPTYVELAKDSAVYSGKGISYVATRLFYGISNYPGKQPGAPATEAPAAQDKPVIEQDKPAVQEQKNEVQGALAPAALRPGLSGKVTLAGGRMLRWTAPQA
jgi:hypothetical protein